MTPFEETSVKAVKQFLQTIVVVDNRANYERAIELVEAGDLVPPGEFATGNLQAQSGSAVIPGTADGPLDATALSRAFACHRLVCAILKPTEDDQMKEAVRNAAHRADILVLDWQMHDDGDLAASIVNEVLDADGNEGRLRLIAIYTSRSPLRSVAASLAAKAPRLASEGQDLVLTAQSTRIILLSKGRTANAPEEQDNAVEESDLPQRLIEEFALLAQGLLSNATMAAIGGIRDHTHRILARFDSDMDGPLLTHRTLLSSPADADEFAGDMIMGELQAQVPIRRIVSDYLNADRIREYVEHRVGSGLEPAIALKDDDDTRLFKLDVDQTCAVIEQGAVALDPLIEDMFRASQGKIGGKINANDLGGYKGKLGSRLHRRLYRLMGSDTKQGIRSHDEFAVRSKMRRDARSPPERTPRLRLGSVVARGDDLWVCITPSCDSIRLPTDGGSFLFAELNTSDQGFELVVPDQGKHRRVTLQQKRPRLVSLHFRPDASREVVAIKQNDQLVFIPDGEAGGDAPAPLRWLAELKPMHAQRLVQSYASNLSRVAVDDFEWHRKQMPGGSAE